MGINVVISSAPRLAEQAISGGCEQLESCRQQPAASSRIWGTEMLHALEMKEMKVARVPG